MTERLGKGASPCDVLVDRSPPRQADIVRPEAEALSNNDTYTFRLRVLSVAKNIADPTVRIEWMNFYRGLIRMSGRGLRQWMTDNLGFVQSVAPDLAFMPEQDSYPTAVPTVTVQESGSTVGHGESPPLVNMWEELNPDAAPAASAMPVAPGEVAEVISLSEYLETRPSNPKARVVTEGSSKGGTVYHLATYDEWRKDGHPIDTASGAAIAEMAGALALTVYDNRINSGSTPSEALYAATHLPYDDDPSDPSSPPRNPKPHSPFGPISPSSSDPPPSSA